MTPHSQFPKTLLRAQVWALGLGCGWGPAQFLPASLGVPGARPVQNFISNTRH